ncbi:hypothetical protein D3C81_2188390 [compost metagenome]
MGYVRDKLLADRLQLPQLLSHDIETSGQLPDFVITFRLQAYVEITFGHPSGRPSQKLKRTYDITGRDQNENTAAAQNE